MPPVVLQPPAVHQDKTCRVSHARLRRDAQCRLREWRDPGAGLAPPRWRHSRAPPVGLRSSPGPSPHQVRHGFFRGQCHARTRPAPRRRGGRGGPGRRGVDRLGERAEADATFIQILDSDDELADPPCQAIEPSDDERVAFAHPVEPCGQLWPAADGRDAVPVRSGRPPETRQECRRRQCTEGGASVGRAVRLLLPTASPRSFLGRFRTGS